MGTIKDHSRLISPPLPLCSHHFDALCLHVDRGSVSAGRNSSKYEEIFPQDEVYRVGSKATFCCLLPDGKTFDKMYLSPHNGSYPSPEKISDRRYALTVQLGPAWARCVDVKCTTKDQEDYGACLYVGCEYDLDSL